MLPYCGFLALDYGFQNTFGLLTGYFELREEASIFDSHSTAAIKEIGRIIAKFSISPLKINALYVYVGEMPVPGLWRFGVI
jgi:hypothetical protein